MEYKKDAINIFVDKAKIKKTVIAKQFNQTNNVTVNRWLSGEDIYFTKIVKLCNIYKFDILSFLEVNGKVLRSTIMDVIALEEQGQSVRELMQNNNLRVADEATFLTLSPDFNQPCETIEPIEVKESESAKELAHTPEWFVDKIVEIIEIKNKEKQEELDRQHTHLQQIIDSQNVRINELNKYNKKLKLEIESRIKEIQANEEKITKYLIDKEKAI